MTRYTQKQLREMVLNGIAEKVTGYNQIKLPRETVGYSMGVYGDNGALIKDSTGKLYAIIGRSTLLDYYF